MKNDIYNVMKQLELKSSWDEFNFVQTLMEQVNNDFWKQKQNVWYILSSACNDAAGEFYVKIREYVKNLTDIDVCNIHSLKSIAKSVNAEHLTDFIFQNYPKELMDLINIFSIKPTKLLEYGQQLHYSVMIPLYGNLDVRNCLVRSQDYSKTLILQILNNIDDIEKLLIFNNASFTANLRQIINTSKNYDLLNIIWQENKKSNPNITDSTNIKYLNNDTNQFDFFTFKSTYFCKLARGEEQILVTNNDWILHPQKYGIEYIKNKSVDDVYGYTFDSFQEIQNQNFNFKSKYLDLKLIIDNIKNISQYLKLLDITSKQNIYQLNKPLNSKLYSDINDEQTLETFVENVFTKANLVVQFNGIFIFNPFFALIECIKSYFYSRDSLHQFKDFYIEYDTGVTRNLKEICKHIIETINNNDQAYIKHYMNYHFYNLFTTNILNDQINNDFEFKKQNEQYDIEYVSKYSELTYDEFISQVSSYLSTKEINQFLSNQVQISHYKRSYINFIKYLFVVNCINGYNETKDEKLFPYQMYLYNNTIDKTEDFNAKFRQLFGLDQNGEHTKKDYIQNVVDQFIDLCIKITYVRQDIKALIQQYSFIGTQKIITNVLRDYFIKNFSKRSSWRYVSDLFRNRDNENILKSIEELNGTNTTNTINKNIFQPSIIEYYDSTDYLNIATELPSCIIKTKEIKVPVNSSFITESSFISTYILTSDMVSTILDEFPFDIPEDVYPSTTMLTTYVVDPIYLSGNVLSTTVIQSPYNNIISTTFTILTAVEFQDKVLSTMVNTADPNTRTGILNCYMNNHLFKIPQMDNGTYVYFEIQFSDDSTFTNITYTYSTKNNIVAGIESLYINNENFSGGKIVKEHSNKILKIKFNEKYGDYYRYRWETCKLNDNQEEEHISYSEQIIKYEISIPNLEVFPYEKCSELQRIAYNNQNEIILYPNTQITLEMEPSNIISNINFNLNATIYNKSKEINLLFTYNNKVFGPIQLSSIIKDKYMNDIIFDSPTDTITLYGDRIVTYKAPFVSQNYDNYDYSLYGLSATLSTVSKTIPLTTYTITSQVYEDIKVPEFISMGTDIIIQPSTLVSAGFLSGLVTSFIIPSGTQVSTYIPADSFVTSTILSTGYEETIGLCADFIQDYNIRFWQRDLNNLTYNELKKEISFYQNYFDELNEAQTEEQKVDIYKTKIYPLLTSSWDTFATSGLLQDGLSSIHYQYSGEYPAKYPTINIGNKKFLTIAPLPFIPNLIQTDVYDKDDIYTIKPLYDNIAYYMNLLMIDLFNMYKINSNGLSIAKDGWKQTNIEFKGYSSRYEKSNNTLDISQKESQKIDVDGPWVYSSLIEFLRLYNQGISSITIDNYINNYYFNISEKQKQIIKTQLLNYKDRIFNKQKYKIYDYQTDIYNNQYVLFKHKDYMKYEDAGQIWIRIKNHPLSLPVMNKNMNNFIGDESLLDIIQINNIKYNNMFKQLCNNAVQFGIKNNVIWILGYTNYFINNNGVASFSNDTLFLRLVCTKFKYDQKLNKIIINTRDIKSYSNDQNYNSILLQHKYGINQFIGVNYNSNKDSLDFVLLDPEKTTYYNKKDVKVKNQNLDNSKIYIKIFSYYLSDEVENDETYKTIKFQNSLFPMFNIVKVNTLLDPYIYQNSSNVGQTYITSAILLNNNNQILQLEGTIYNIDNDVYSLIGNVYIINEQEQESSKKVGTIEFSINQIDSCTSSIQLSNLNIINLKINNKNIQFEKLFLQKDFIRTYISNENIIKESYQNIWRLSQTQNQVSIAYEAVNSIAVGQSDILSAYDIEKNNNTNHISYLFYDAQLITKSFLDYNGNLVYLNQIKNISSTIEDEALNFKIEEFTEDYAKIIQNEYPYCNLTKNNHLQVKMLPTTLGNNKNIYLRIKNSKTDFSDPNGYNIITSLVDSEPSSAVQKMLNTIETISIQRPYLNYLNQQIYEIYPLSKGIEEVKQIFSQKLTGYIDFYQYYNEYIEAKRNHLPISEQSKILNKYNKHMNELTKIVNFSSTLTDFIIEPLKILFSFGDFYNENYNLMGSEYFDLDISVYLDTLQQKNLRVGWKCGRYKTDYINWISYDQRFGGPQITVVDINKYVLDNQKKIERKQITELNIIVNACWFVESQIQTQNPNIIINWRGFTYHFIVQDIQVNEGCCDYSFIEINIDLLTNAVTCSKSIYLPAIIKKKNDPNIYIGFITKYERYLKDFFEGQKIKTIKNDMYELQILNKQYYNYIDLYNYMMNDSNFLDSFGLYYIKPLKDKDHLDYEVNINIENIEFYNKFILI